MPFVIASLIGLVFGKDGGTPHGLLLIADEDGGMAGSLLRQSIERGPLADIFTIQMVRQEDGRRRMRRGDASALVIVPAGYDMAVMLRRSTQLTLITNPELSILPRIVYEAVAANVDGAFYVQQTGSMKLPDAGVEAKTRGVPKARRISVPEMLFPGVVLLVILMMSAGLSLEIWKERSAGSVRRIVASPVSLTAFMAGKVAATSLVLLLAIAIAFAAARVLFHLPMQSWGAALAWAFLCAIVCYCGSVLVQLLFARERTSNAVAGMTMVPLAMLGGSFFPMQTMGGVFGRIAGYTPNGWMLLKLRAIIEGRTTGAQLLAQFTVLLIVGAILLALVQRCMRRRFAA